MSKPEFSAKQIADALEAVADLQKDGCKFPCPRCGRTMREPMLYNCLSRHEEIYVCEMCGMDEALMDACGKVKPLQDWYFVSLLCDTDGSDENG